MTEQVGYIGLGIMGRPAALNLMNAGYPVRVWARRDESMVPLIDAGATACRSPADVAESADIVFTNVSDTPDVEEVLLGEQGVIHGARPGSVVVDMSTISPLATQRMAAVLEKKGVDMLDAPVSGGEQGAVSGTLSFMVGGKADVFDRVRPLFEVMGRNIVHCGDNGAGQVTKACNQIVITQTIAAVGEAFVFARKNGVDPARVREALLGGFAGSRVLEAHGQRMIDHDFNPGFKARLHRKDMRIVLETAAEIGVGLPGAALGTQYLNALVGAGDGELDSSAIYGLQELMARLTG
jgi:2-hydroxy-3-oxopropionate reductase